MPRLREEIIEAYAGASVRAVADRFKVSVRQVRAVLEAARVDLRPVGRPAAADPDVAVRLRTVLSPAPAPVLPVADAPATVAAPEPSPATVATPAPSRVPDIERAIFDFGKNLDDPRPVLWRCPACRRPQYEPGSEHCVCGWLFITGETGPPQRPRMFSADFDPHRAIFVDPLWGPQQW